MSNNGASLNVESVTGHAVIRLQHDVSAAYEPQQALLDQASTEQIFLPSTSLGSSQVQLQRIDQLTCRLGSTQPPRLRFAGRELTVSTSCASPVAGAAVACSRCLIVGCGTNPSVCSPWLTPPTPVLPAPVTAPISWLVTGEGGLPRRWRPPMPVSPPRVLVAAPTRPSATLGSLLDLQRTYRASACAGICVKHAGRDHCWLHAQAEDHRVCSCD